MDLAEDVFRLTKKIPSEERYNLNSQINRAVDSIALNISEGSIGQSNLEQKRFMNYAIRSLAEVVTCLHKAKRRSYVSQENFNSYYKECFNLMNMMIGFKKQIK